MTREEAKRNLIYSKRWGDMPNVGTLDMAIKALEQESCGNAISRKHLLEEIALLKKSPWFNENTYGSKVIRKEAVEIVEDVCIKREPSVSPQPILAKIRAEIDIQEKWLVQAGYNAHNVDIAFDAIKHLLTESEVEE